MRDTINFVGNIKITKINERIGRNMENITINRPIADDHKTENCLIAYIPDMIVGAQITQNTKTYTDIEL
jgi:hypothetical protein